MNLNIETFFCIRQKTPRKSAIVNYWKLILIQLMKTAKKTAKFDTAWQTRNMMKALCCREGRKGLIYECLSEIGAAVCECVVSGRWWRWGCSHYIGQVHSSCGGWASLSWPCHPSRYVWVSSKPLCEITVAMMADMQACLVVLVWAVW